MVARMKKRIWWVGWTTLRHDEAEHVCCKVRVGLSCVEDVKFMDNGKIGRDEVLKKLHNSYG